jgi:hypothetical protein
MRASVVFFLIAFSAAAEVRTLTLRDALDIALKQNPDVILARLDQQRARAQVTIAKDPFLPKLFAGSGAAWTNGFPMSIDGNAPAIIQARAPMAIFDRPQSFRAAQANEVVRGMEFDIGMSRMRPPTGRVAVLRCRSGRAQPVRSQPANGESGSRARSDGRPRFGRPRAFHRIQPIRS